MKIIDYSRSQEYFLDQHRSGAVALRRSYSDAILNASNECQLYVPRWIATAFKRLAEDAPVAVREKPSGGKDPERKRRLRFVRFHVEGIRKLVVRELASLAGMTVGSKELDGD